MQEKRTTKKLICFLVSIFIVTSFSGYAGNTESTKYKELLRSYEKDEDYKNSTNVIKKSVNSIHDESSMQSFGNTTNAKIEQIITNTGKLSGVPILIYHCVDSTIWGDKPMFVSPDNFAKQMEYLHNQKYEAITFNNLDQINLIKKPVLITFDDGYEDNFTNAYPVLQRYGFKATIFLVADFIDKPNFLKLKEIKKMQDIIDFQSHTMTHPHLAGLDPVKVQFELSESKKSLESSLGKKIDVIAYPYGSYDSSVIDIAKQYYTFGVTTNYGKFVDTPINEYTIKRMYVLNQMNLNKFIKLFK
jgi:peptidoglycan/xylan/chitin deacetylase (PgdA/CDA1 family)